MNKFRLFIFSTISIGILFSIFTLTLLNPNEKLIEVSSFPSFEMEELTEDIINQDAFIEGEYKLINVWATWCVNCKLEHGFLMNLKNKGIKICTQKISTKMVTGYTDGYTLTLWIYCWNILYTRLSR